MHYNLIMNKFTELQQSFFKHLRNLFDLSSGKDENEVNDMLINQANSEEEKKVIQEICAEVDIEHRLMDELENSGMDSGGWLEREIENTTKELYPNATPEEVEMVKQRVQDGMEEEIESEIDILEGELSINLLPVNDSTNSEEEKEGSYE